MNLRTLLLSCTVGASLCGLVACKDSPTDPALAVVESGTLRGSVLGDGTREFLGVPYAAPPTGERRWRAPQAPLPWTGERAATARGASCPQPSPPGSDTLAGDEDCLFLNVWAPSGVSKAPVMLWLHGGGYFVGGGGDPDYDGRLFAKATGTIVVTINYRLGPLGFFASPALDAEDKAHPTSGNYALEDQRAALEWVQRNIAAFGGDPKTVTLFGESAGANSTCLHLASARSKGLFARAILESGTCSVGPKDEVVATSAKLAETLGCTDLACLRGKSFAEILQAGSNGGFYPSIDGWNLTEDPYVTLKTSKLANDVPVLMGANHDEAGFDFGMGFLPAVTDATSYAELMNGIFQDKGAAVLAQYPASSYADAQQAAIAALTDVWYFCPQRGLAQSFAKLGSKVYFYSFDRAPSSPLFPGAGAFHSSEVPFVFGTSSWGIVLDAQEQGLSTSMMGYWSRMAEAADPNGDGAVAWPLFDAQEAHLVLDLQIKSATGLRGGKCAFWETL